MLKLVSLLGVLPALWRFARDMAKALEETIPEDGYGSEKLKTVDAVLRVALRASDDTSSKEAEKIAEIGEGLTQSAVALLKATGELQSIAKKATADLSAVASEAEDIVEAAVEEANSALDSQDQ